MSYSERPDVIVYDFATGKARAVLNGFETPRQGVRLSPDGKDLYVTNHLGDKITVVDTATDKITGEIKGFDKLSAISVTADGKTIFAANSGSNTIAAETRCAIDRARRTAPDLPYAGMCATIRSADTRRDAVLRRIDAHLANTTEMT